MNEDKQLARCSGVDLIIGGHEHTLLESMAGHAPIFKMTSDAREMGRIFHAKGVERLVRNDLWKGREPERFYDALEWLYGWRVENCLAA